MARTRRLTFILIFVALAMSISACGGTRADSPVAPAGGATVAPADGPAAAPATEAPGKRPAPVVANFDQKYVYPRGTEVEVTKKGTDVLSDYTFTPGGDPGDSFVTMTIRITNGTDFVLENLVGVASVTYGDDGEKAQQVFQTGLDLGFNGNLIPGKSKSATYGFLIPAGGRDDVTLEFSPSFGSEIATFSGSVN